MKRGGFLGAIAGALAVSALPIPKLPAPASFRVTYGSNWVSVLGPVVGRTPKALYVQPALLETAREILGSGWKP